MLVQAPVVDRWKKILVEASRPINGTSSRKLREGISITINESVTLDTVYIYINHRSVRFTVQCSDGFSISSHYNLEKIYSMETLCTATMVSEN